MATVYVPGEGICRIARIPNNPFDLPDWSWAGDDGAFGNRFDDPGGLLEVRQENRYRVLYCATQRQAAFAEVTARFRVDPRVVLRLAQINDAEPLDQAILGAVDPAHVEHGLLEHDWLTRRRFAHSLITTDSPVVDISHADTLAHLDLALAPLLDLLNLREIDLSTVTSQSRRVTQYASRYIYNQGFAGIRYASRLGSNRECWALFENRYRHEPGYPTLPAAISADDPDLLNLAKRFGLSIELLRGQGHYLRPWQVER